MGCKLNLLSSLDGALNSNVFEKKKFQNRPIRSNFRSFSPVLRARARTVLKKILKFERVGRF